MAYTQEQYTALCEAIAQGVLKVEYSDKKVEYRSLSEMLQIKKEMEQQLGLSNPANRRLFAIHDKGV